MERKKSRSAFLLLFFVKQNCKNKITALDFVAHIFIGMQKKKKKRHSSCLTAEASGGLPHLFPLLKAAKAALRRCWTQGIQQAVQCYLFSTLFCIPFHRKRTKMREKKKKRMSRFVRSNELNHTDEKHTHTYIYQVHRHAEIYISTGAPN